MDSVCSHSWTTAAVQQPKNSLCSQFSHLFVNQSFVVDCGVQLVKKNATAPHWPYPTIGTIRCCTGIRHFSKYGPKNSFRG
jgi:hypothetical protein